jgi:hypothetical protein
VAGEFQLLGHGVMTFLCRFCILPRPSLGVPFPMRSSDQR